MEQNTAKWHAWRASGLGSSDAPIILGLSKYATPYQLWEQKTGKVQREEGTNFIQDKGNRAEIFSRARLELEVGFDLPPAQGQHQEHTFLLASADGWNPEMQVGCELKLASKEDHDNVLKGIIPAKYFPQVQQAIYVFGAKYWIYGSYWCDKGMAVDKGDLRYVKVEPDIKWIAETYLPQMLYFRDCVVNDKAPEMTDADARFVKGKEHLDVVAKFIEVNKRLDEAAAVVSAIEEEYEKIEAELLEIAGPAVKTIFGDTGVSLTRSWKKGNVQYAQIPELKDVDLEKYRAPSSPTKKFNFPKKKKTT